MITASLHVNATDRAVARNREIPAQQNVVTYLAQYKNRLIV